MLLSVFMKRQAFTLIELLIVVTVLAVLVGAAMPYYQDYVRETRLTKARHELDLIRQALIKYDTMEERPFRSDNLRLLLGRYMQDLPADPWGREYRVDWQKGQVFSLGPDHTNPRDRIVVDYKPPLALQKAIWLDLDRNRMVSASDVVRLEFSRLVAPNRPVLLGSETTSPANVDLLFSPEVRIADFIATHTPTTSNFIYLPIGSGANSTTFFPGSSTVRVASGNANIVDYNDNPAAGTREGFPGQELTILPF